MSDAARVRDLRRALGVSQDGLARRLKVTTNTISKWEQGLRVPAPKMQARLARLAERWGVPWQR